MTYVVIENTPGYLPDADEPAEFEGTIEANEYACELVCELVNDHGYEVVESSPAGPLSHATEPLFVRLERPGMVAPDLGRVVEVQQVEPPVAPASGYLTGFGS